jgi:ankyrin repeat protein
MSDSVEVMPKTAVAADALLSAVNSDRPLERLQELIEADASILQTRFDGLEETILHVLAIRKGRSTRDMIDVILRAGVLSINVMNAKGQTPLHSCVFEFNAFMVPFLVSRGADALALDTKGRNCLQLMIKAVNGLSSVERDDGYADAAARATAMSVRRCVSDDDWSSIFEQAAEDEECCEIAFGAMELANEFEGVSRARFFALDHLDELDAHEFSETVAAAAADEAAAAREAAAVAEAIAWLAASE